MKIIRPKPIFLEGGDKAVLLLHSFTGTTKDLAKLARFLHQEGYTCYAPLFSGHGLPPHEIAHSNTDVWWQNTLDSYNDLKAKGYASIAVVGLSLGAIFTLKLGTMKKLPGLIMMSAPNSRERRSLENRFLQYVKNYGQLQGKSKLEIENQKNEELLTNLFYDRFIHLIEDTTANLSRIESPSFILYGLLDESLYKQSAHYIYQHISSPVKKIRGYNNAEHLMTLSSDREQIQMDILNFLNGLKW